MTIALTKMYKSKNWKEVTEKHKLWLNQFVYFVVNGKKKLFQKCNVEISFYLNKYKNECSADSVAHMERNGRQSVLTSVSSVTERSLRRTRWPNISWNYTPRRRKGNK